MGAQYYLVQKQVAPPEKVLGGKLLCTQPQVSKQLYLMQNYGGRPTGPEPWLLSSGGPLYLLLS